MWLELKHELKHFELGQFEHHHEHGGGHTVDLGDVIYQ
jgi:hypothetical protein